MRLRPAHALLSLLLIACDGGSGSDGEADGGPADDDAGLELDAQVVAPTVRFELLGGAGSPGSTSLLQRPGGSVELVGFGGELILSDGSRESWAAPREFFGPAPLSRDSLHTVGEERSGISSDGEWVFFPEDSTMDGEPVPGPAWVRRSDRRPVDWPTTGGGYTAVDADGTYWSAGIAPATATFAGEPLGTGDELVGYIAAWDADGIREAWPIAGEHFQLEGFWLAPEGDLVFLFNGGRDADGDVFGAPLLADRSAIVRVDPDTRAVLDRSDASVRVDLGERLTDVAERTLTFQIEPGGTATLDGVEYASIDGRDTWLVVTWDGAGSLPSPLRSTVAPYMRDDRGFVPDDWALSNAPGADVLGPPAGRPMWGRMDAANEHVERVVTASVDRLGGTVNGTAAAVQVHLWAEGPVELGRATLEPLAPGGTLHLVEMDLDRAEVVRHARYPSEVDPDLLAWPVSVDASHALLTRSEMGPSLVSLSLVSYDGDPEIPLDAPEVTGSGCISVLRHMPEPGIRQTVEPNGVVLFDIRCDEPGHSLRFAGQTLEYTGQSSKTAFRVTVD